VEAQKLEVRRQEASLQSLGISHPIIHQTIEKILNEKSLNEGLLLDVGAGVGDFVRQMQEHKQFQLHAVDLMYSKVAGVEWFVQDLNRLLQFKGDKFNVVSCIEVLEHVENPRKLIREMFRVLKPGGYLIASTPNNQSWRAILSYVFREHFVAFTNSSYPAHITAMNKMDLQRMCDEAGFQSIEFFYTNSGTLPKWTKWKWQDIHKSAFQGMRYSDNIIVVAQKNQLTLVANNT
jgi:2-polyprenyl-3-methyl-5-hydroxy-6-metoxy-1,4-benzoquinol methylase